MHVVVIGGTGHIGTYLSPRLVDCLDTGWQLLDCRCERLLRSTAETIRVFVEEDMETCLMIGRG